MVCISCEQSRPGHQLLVSGKCPAVFEDEMHALYHGYCAAKNGGPLVARRAFKELIRAAVRAERLRTHPEADRLRVIYARVYGTYNVGGKRRAA